MVGQFTEGFMRNFAPQFFRDIVYMLFGILFIFFLNTASAAINSELENLRAFVSFSNETERIVIFLILSFFIGRVLKIIGDSTLDIFLSIIKEPNPFKHIVRPFKSLRIMARMQSSEVVGINTEELQLFIDCFEWLRNERQRRIVHRNIADSAIGFFLFFYVFFQIHQETILAVVFASLFILSFIYALYMRWYRLRELNSYKDLHAKFKRGDLSIYSN